MRNTVMEKLMARTNLERLLSPRALELLRIFTYHRLYGDGSSGTVNLWLEFLMECSKDNSSNYDEEIYGWLMKTGLKEKEVHKLMDEFSTWLYALRTAKKYDEHGTLLSKDEPAYREPGSF